MRLLLPLILCAGLRISCGQTLPPYLIDTFPASNATGVRTNVNIILRARVSLPIPPLASGGMYTLKTQTGAPLTFTPLPNCGCFATVLIPSAPLSPNTLYSFTVNPSSEIGSSYSFSFTTGSSADRTPPHLLSVDPPSGTSGLGLGGPFKFQFDKRLTRTLQANDSVTASTTNGDPGYPSLTLSDDGTTLIVRVNPSRSFPAGYDITVDPTKFADMFGNVGQGAPMTAHYSTFVTNDASGPHLKSSLPADGDTGVATNVLPRLIFRKGINDSTASKGIELRGGGSAVTATYSSIGNYTFPNYAGGVVITPSKPLEPNQTYTLAINSGLRDTNGFPVQEPQTIHFTTGSGPDVVAPAVLGYSPANDAPPNAVVTIRTNKPIAPIVLDRLATIGLIDYKSGESPTPVSATLSNDGMLLTLTPQTVLPAKTFTVPTGEIVDASGAPFYPSPGNYWQLRVSGDEDHTPPAVSAVSPPADSDAVPLSSTIQLRFNEVCANCLFPGAITVAVDGSAKPVRVTGDGFSFTVNAGSLSPSTTYTVSTSGIVDLAGNAMPDYSFRFATAAGADPAPQLKLLDSSLASGDTGVSPSGPFVLNYDSALNPVSAATAVLILGPSGVTYPVRANASGARLTITPLQPLPASTSFFLNCTVSSLFGRALSTQIQFSTGASDDTTRPEVTRISPGEDAVISQLPVSFVLTFSEPVNPSTITADSISVYSANRRIDAKPVRAEDGRSVSFTVAEVTGVSFSVIASSAIQDNAGNPLVPFTASYRVEPAPINKLVHEMRPAFYSTGIPENTPITWFLERPIDLAMVQDNVLVLVDKSPFPGSFDLSGGGRILRFSPATPFPAGARVSFYERTLLLDSLHEFSEFYFTVATDPAPSLTMVRTTMNGSAALDTVFEFEFTQDPPLGQNIATLTLDRLPVEFTESIPRPRVLRLTTKKPRQPGTYSVVLSSKITAPSRYLSCTLRPTSVGGSATIISAGPVGGATGVPLNASVRAMFGAQVNPLSVTPQTAVLSVGGRILNVQRTFPDDRGVILSPLEALPVNTLVDVRMAGLEDLAGRPFPAANWSFTTGVDPDLEGPSILSSSLPYTEYGNFEIGSHDAIQLIFSEPVAPGITVEILSQTIQGFQDNVSVLSQDLRTLTIMLVGAWAKGQQYSLRLQKFTDISGNYGTGSPPRGFQVAFDATPMPPRVLAVSPPDGATAMPLNARIMAAFDKPISVPPDAVRLTDSDGNAVPLARVYASEANQVIFAPVRVLRPNSAYSFSISGASDMSGNRIESAATASFVTGDAPDYVRPSGSVLLVSPFPTNLPLQIRFNEPISPVSVNPQQIQLLAGNAPQPAELLLSGDRMSITLKPRQQLVPGHSYTLKLSDLCDFAGNTWGFGGSSQSTFIAGDSPDTTPPTITIFPPDGTAGFPISNSLTGNVYIRVVFSKSVDTLTSPPRLRVFKDGNPVSGTTTVSSNGITFRPSPAFEYNSTYRVEVSDVVDYMGNAAAPASSTFTTNQSVSDDRAPFRVSSIQPADGSVGIPGDAPVVVSFSKLFDTGYSAQVRTLTGPPMLGSWSPNGSVLTFTPSDPWPSAVTIVVTVSRQSNGNLFRDLSGSILDRDYTVRFTTAVREDSTPPTLISITPAPGTPLSPISTTFTLVFSEPVVIGPQGLQAFNGSQVASLTSYAAQSTRTIRASVNLVEADSVLTLLGTASIHDDAGNSLAPFSVQYPTLKTDESGYPKVLSISPQNYATAVPPNTPIKIQFNKAMNPESLQASVRVTQDGEEIAGQLQALDSNHAVQFTPSSPYRAGTRIDTFVLNTALDSSGNRLSERYQSYFTVAGTTGTISYVQRMSVSLVGFADTVDPGAALDLAFDRELDVSTAAEQNLWLRAGNTRIAGAVVLRNSRTLRFQPSEPLRAGEQYVLTAGPDLRSVEGLSNEPREFRFRVDPAAVDVRVESIEYLLDRAPFAVRVRFTGPVNATSADSLKLLAPDGSVVGASASFSTDGREWLLVLPKPQPVRVVIDGVEDKRGRRLPRESREPVLAR